MYLTWDSFVGHIFRATKNFFSWAPRKKFHPAHHAWENIHTWELFWAMLWTFSISIWLMFHRPGFQSGDQLIIKGWQTLEQSHNNIFIFFRYLHANKPICKYFDLVDVVQQDITFLHLVCEKLKMNEENVGQDHHLIDVAKGFSCFCWSFTTFYICKLAICQIKCNDGHFLLGTPFIIFLHFGIIMKR